MTLLLAIIAAGGVALLWSVARRPRRQRRTSMAGDGSLDADNSSNHHAKTDHGPPADHRTNDSHDDGSSDSGADGSGD